MNDRDGYHFEIGEMGSPFRSGDGTVTLSFTDIYDVPVALKFTGDFASLLPGILKGFLESIDE